MEQQIPTSDTFIVSFGIIMCLVVFFLIGIISAFDLDYAKSINELFSSILPNSFTVNPALNDSTSVMLRMNYVITNLCYSGIVLAYCGGFIACLTIGCTKGKSLSQKTFFIATGLLRIYGVFYGVGNMQEPARYESELVTPKEFQ